jgi:hypothetical protein
MDEGFNLIEVLQMLPDAVPEGQDPELAGLFAEDQQDRADGELAAGSDERDRVRRARGMAKLFAGEMNGPALSR